MFKPGAKTQKLSPIRDINYKDGLKIYGLKQQSQFGDINESKPYSVMIERKLKWNAWNEQKGKSKEQAITEGIALTERLLQEHKISTVDPMKKVIEKRFIDCQNEYRKKGIRYQVKAYEPVYDEKE